MEIRRKVYGSLSVCAPDSAKDFEEYEKFTGAVTKCVHESRREAVRRLYIAGDLNIELGLMRTDEDEELRDVYGPQWHGIDADPGRLGASCTPGFLKQIFCVHFFRKKL